MATHQGALRIIATGRYVPDLVVTNDDLSHIVDTSDDWITSRTGISERRVAFLEATSDLASKAAEAAIRQGHFDKTQIDLIIVATFTPDLRSPSVASLVQMKLGLNHLNIIAFDINAACTGFVYALNIADKMLNSGAYHYALVIGAEVISKVTDYTDRNTCVLFGDGAGAMILCHDPQKVAYFNVASRGDGDQILYVDDTVHMDGQKVFQFAAKVFSETIQELLKMGRIIIETIKKIIPHQANLRIIQHAAKTLDVPMDRFFINIQKYGNTSAASIPIAFAELAENDELMSGDQVIFVGFGAGLTWGSCLLTL